MNDVTKENLQTLIRNNPGIVEFGSHEDAVDQIWYTKAEEVLGVKLTASYLWFLKNYRGGDICGDEVYSIYGMEFKEAHGGDIVYHHLLNLKDKFTTPKKIVVTSTDLGEVLYFNYNEYRNSECPIYLRLPSGNSIFYAKNFYEFLYKRIQNCLEN